MNLEELVAYIERYLELKELFVVRYTGDHFTGTDEEYEEFFTIKRILDKRASEYLVDGEA